MGREECVEFEVQQALEFRSQGSAIGSCESQPDWAHYRAPREANEGHHEARDDVVSAIVPVVLGKRKMGLLGTNMVSVAGFESFSQKLAYHCRAGNALSLR